MYVNKDDVKISDITSTYDIIKYVKYFVSWHAVYDTARLWRTARIMFEQKTLLLLYWDFRATKLQIDTNRWVSYYLSKHG